MVAFSDQARKGLLSARRYGDQASTRSDFTTPEEVNEVYRRRARFYDWSVNAYYLIGFRWWAYRRRAIAALGLQPGATIVIADGCHGVTRYQPDCEKIMRLHAQTALIENGFVRIPETAPWFAEYLH
jgi:hypothetical protein